MLCGIDIVLEYIHIRSKYGNIPQNIVSPT